MAASLVNKKKYSFRRAINKAPGAALGLIKRFWGSNNSQVEKRMRSQEEAQNHLQVYPDGCDDRDCDICDAEFSWDSGSESCEDLPPVFCQNGKGSRCMDTRCDKCNAKFGDLQKELDRMTL